MKKLCFYILVALLAGCQGPASPDAKVVERYTPEWESLAKHEESPEWFRDAKLGIYFHWGVYSVPAYGNEWYPRNMHLEGQDVNKHHLETYGHPSEFGYHDFVPLFKAEHFDAAQWADLFQKAGARFAGPVAEHHDGFSMWDSDATPWNVADMGPKKDITGLLAAELRKRNIRLITTFHHAKQLQRHDTIGIDLVAMCVNDVVVQGAEPLFFLDYFACGRLDPRVASDVVKGVAQGCELAGCALIGGETAEMPGMYPDGEYDLAGFCVGVVERDAIVDGRAIAPGDVLLGLASSGAHSNGYSLVRKILERARPDLEAAFDGRTLGQALLEPTRIYARALLALIAALPVKGIAHITGGGITGNVPRVLPAGTRAVIEARAWPRPALFDWLQREGGVAETEMHRVFNCGIGMVIALAAGDAPRARELLTAAGETVFEIGRIERGDDGEAQAIVV